MGKDCMRMSIFVPGKRCPDFNAWIALAGFLINSLSTFSLIAR